MADALRVGRGYLQGLVVELKRPATRKGTVGIVEMVPVSPGRPSTMPWMGPLIATSCSLSREVVVVVVKFGYKTKELFTQSSRH